MERNLAVVPLCHEEGRMEAHIRGSHSCTRLSALNVAGARKIKWVNTLSAGMQQEVVGRPLL